MKRQMAKTKSSKGKSKASAKKIVMGYIPCKDGIEAKEIADRLLKKKIIFCANIFPVVSVCNWKGKRQTSGEAILIAKTFESRFAELEKEAIDGHSYDTPAIIKINAEANGKYIAWARGELK